MAALQTKQTFGGLWTSLKMAAAETQDYSQ
jgi:hypothetical protein